MNKKQQQKLQKKLKKAENRKANEIALDKKHEKLKRFLESKGVYKSKEEIIELIKGDELIHKTPPKNYSPDGGILNVRKATRNNKGLK